MLDQVERVEIVRGNVSSLYGSNAVGGVIQVFTKRGKGEPAPSASVMAGSRNTSDVHVGYGGEAGNTRFSLSASRFDTKGFSSIDPAAAPLRQPRSRRLSQPGAVLQRFAQAESTHELGVALFNTEAWLDYDQPSLRAADRRAALEPGTVDAAGLVGGTLRTWLVLLRSSPCDSGTAAGESPQKFCQPCPIGFSSTRNSSAGAAGPAQCTPCPPGTFQGVEGQASWYCSPLRNLRYATLTHTAFACAVHRVALANIATRTTRHSVQNASRAPLRVRLAPTNCTNCTAGTVSAADGASQCTPW